MNQMSFILLLVLLWLANLSLSIVGRSTVFTVDLVHRDSPLSPLYDNSLTQSQILRNAVLRSSSSLIDHYDGDYLVSISLGNSYHVHAFASTGSALIWINCDPCRSLHPPLLPLFDFNYTRTYAKLLIGDAFCNNLTHRFEGPEGECLYDYFYDNGEVTTGVLSKETFNLISRVAPPPELLFGCSHQTNIDLKGKVHGVVGIGTGDLSLIWQLRNQVNHRFAYCLVPRSSFIMNSMIRFGYQGEKSDARVSTLYALNPGSPYYYLRLTGVSVQKARAVLSKGSFDGYVDMIIDSGRTMTTLPRSIYNHLEVHILKYFDITPETKRTATTFSLCFLSEKLVYKTAPLIVKFHFEDADVELKHENIFVEYDMFTCLAIAPKRQNDNNYFLGNVVQSNFLVEYDLQDEQISFTPQDCTSPQWINQD